MTKLLGPTGADDAEGVLEGQMPVRAGVAWNAAGQLLARVAVLLFGLALARLLDPRSFGLFGLANAVIALGLVLSNIGVGQALVQRQGDLRENAAAAFYLNLMAIGGFAIAMVLLAGPVARFYEEPVVRQLMVVLALAFFARGVVSVHESYLRKNLKFRRLQACNLVNVTVYGTVAVVLAANGAGPWSLALGLLCGNLVFAVLVVVGSGMPLGLNLHRDHWRGLIGFGGTVFLAGIVWAGVTQGDNLAVGKVLGASALGVYVIAYNYGVMPEMTIGGAIAEVMFAAFARTQDNLARLAGLLAKTIRSLAVICVPLGLIALFVARDAFVLVLGERWADAAVPFQIFSVVFTILMFTAPLPVVYLAADKPRWNLITAVATVPLLVVALMLGLPHGVVGVALAVAIMQAIHSLAHLPIAAHVLGVPAGHLVRQIVPAAVSGLAAAILAGGVFWLVAVPGRAWIAGAMVVPVFLLGLRWWFPGTWSEAGGELRRIVKRKEAT